MNVLDLFSGIGGFSLGLERAGMRTVAFCEIDDYCAAVLRKHWPAVPVFRDVRLLTAASLADADGIDLRIVEQREPARRLPQAVRDEGQAEPGHDGAPRIDLICGGFPCQDISLAGRGAGIEGDRSGLWSEFARIIGELGPRFVIVENVAALRSRGLDRVLRDLAALGYDAEWHCIPAYAVGAPHSRDRIWIVAHRERARLEGHAWNGSHVDQQGRLDAQANGSAGARSVCNATGDEAWRRLFAEGTHGWRDRLGDSDWWAAEPELGRVAHGIPNRVDRLKAIGNAIVPQIAEIIGRELMTR